jgi:hypothetical protein
VLVALVVPVIVASVLANVIFVLVAAVAIGLVVVPIAVSARRRATGERDPHRPS